MIPAMVLPTVPIIDIKVGAIPDTKLAIALISGGSIEAKFCIRPCTDCSIGLP